MSFPIENSESVFATSMTRATLPRWERKALETSEACRFIPSRAGMDFDACHFSMTAENNNTNTQVESPSAAAFRRAIQSNLCGSEAGAKILSFKEAAPAPKQGFQNGATVLYTSNKPTTKAASSAARHIPQNPERILDAPNFKVDFYLNLIDWSATNTIAVALDTTVYLWNATTGSIEELCTMAEGNGVTSVSWSQDGGFLSIGTDDSTVQLWDVARQKKVRTLAGNGCGRVAAQAWNSHILSTGSRTGAIFNNDVRIAAPVVQTMQGHSQEVCGLKWSCDGKQLASGGNDNVVNVWSATGARDHTFTAHQAAVKALAWCPWQSNLLASGGGSADRSIKFWNTQSGALVGSIDAKSQVSSLLWNAEHKEIVSGHGYADNQLSIWKYSTLSKVADLTGHTERVLGMAMSPDGTTVVSAGGDETLRFWKCFATDAAKAKKAKAAAAAAAPASRLTSMIR